MRRRSRKPCICIRIGALSGRNTPQPAKKAIKNPQSTEHISQKVGGWIDTGQTSSDPARVRQALSDLMHLLPLQQRTIWDEIHKIRIRLGQMTTQAA
jgi:hypothetical protein